MLYAALLHIFQAFFPPDGNEAWASFPVRMVAYGGVCAIAHDFVPISRAKMLEIVLASITAASLKNRDRKSVV